MTCVRVVGVLFILWGMLSYSYCELCLVHFPLGSSFSVSVRDLTRPWSGEHQRLCALGGHRGPGSRPW